MRHSLLTSSIGLALSSAIGSSVAAGLDASVKLYQLPQSDSTGKILLGQQLDLREDDLLLPDHEGVPWVIPGALNTLVPGGTVPHRFARIEQNLWPNSDDSANPTTQTISVISGNEYQIRIGRGSAVAATAVCSGAFTGTLTGDATEPQAFIAAATATTASLTVTISGEVADIALFDVTGQGNQNPGEYQRVDAANGLYGFAYYATEKANTVDGAGAVTEDVGAKLDPAPEMVAWPLSTNLFDVSEPVDLTELDVKGGVTVDVLPARWLNLFNNAVAFVDNAQTRYAYQVYTVTVGVAYAFSIYVKMDDLGVPTVGNSSDPTADFLIIFESSGINHVDDIEAIADNVYRIKYTKTATTTNTNFGVVKYTGQSAKGFKIVGYMLEPANFVGPYIAATGAPVSRDAVASQIPITGKVNQTEGVVHVRFTPTFAQTTLSATAEGIVSLRDAATSLLYMDSAGFKSTDGTNIATANATFIADTEIEIAVRWSTALNELQIGYNDGSWTWGTIVNYNGGFTEGAFINWFYGLESGGASMSKSDIYNKDMTIAQIEALP